MSDRRPELGEIMARIAADDDLRARFERDPAGLLGEMGVTEIPDELLDAVVGGAKRGTFDIGKLLEKEGTTTFAPPYVPTGPYDKKQ